MPVINERVGPLELKLAELTGAMTVLRSLGGIGINFRGAYDADIEYDRHDVIALDGGSFVARRDKPGPCPGEHWQQLCARGERGGRGPIGVRGLQGEKGEKGERAPTPVISSWHTDVKRYITSPLMSDGSVGAPLELRPLFQKFLDDVSGGKR
jgi:hypothetical protein